jgi:hypothetical protein
MVDNRSIVSTVYNSSIVPTVYNIEVLAPRSIIEVFSSWFILEVLSPRSMIEVLSPQSIIEILSPGLEVRNHTHVLNNTVNGPGNTKWLRTLSSVGNLLWHIYRASPQSKYQSLSLRCRIPPRHLSQLKAHGNTFELNSKWSRTLPSVCNFSWNIYTASPPNPSPPSQIQISKLIVDNLLWA